MIQVGIRDSFEHERRNAKTKLDRLKKILNKSRLVMQANTSN